MAGHPEKRLGRFYSVTHFLYRFLHAYKLNPFSPRKVKIPISRKGSSPQIFSWQTAKQSSFQQIDREILEPSDCRQSPYRKFRNLASETVLFAPLSPKALLSCSPSALQAKNSYYARQTPQKCNRFLKGKAKIFPYCCSYPRMPRQLLRGLPKLRKWVGILLLRQIHVHTCHVEPGVFGTVSI